MCRKPARHSDGQAGFTLLELVVVVGVIAIMLVVLVIGVRRASDAFSLRRGTSIALSEVRRAHAGAVAEGVDYIVEFYATTGASTPGGIRVWKRNGATTEWVRSILPPDWPSSVQMMDGPTNFPACTGAGPDAAHDCAVFKPLGYLEQSGGSPQNRIRLRSIGSGLQMEVVIAPATARASVERP